MTPFTSYLQSSSQAEYFQRLLGSALAFTLVALVGCREEPTTPPSPIESLDLAPRRIVLFEGDTVTFSAHADGSPVAVTWHIAEGLGTIESNGRFAAPEAISGDSSFSVIEARAAGSPMRVGRARVVTLADSSLRACYERDVRPIIRSSCAMAECHDPGSRQRGFDFTSDYVVQRSVTAGEPDASLIYLMVTHPDDDKRMPPAPRPRLSPAMIATIARWIEQGAVPGRCPTPGEQPCDTANARYSSVIRPILLSSCMACHDGSTGDNGGVDLSTFEGVKAVAESGQLLGSLKHAPGYAPMPSLSSRLPDCEILKVQAWIDMGAPNN